VIFDVSEDDDWVFEPFYNNQHLVIEKILCEDDGKLTSIELVHKIATFTRVLITPYFVELSRMAAKGLTPLNSF
jgi:hypothetical protein